MTIRTTLKSRRRGVVLFMVVAIVLMMTLLTYAFLLSMRTQNLAASQAGDQLQSRQAAFSARELVCGLLEDSLLQRHSVGGLQQNEFRFRNIKLEWQGEESDEFTPVGMVYSSEREIRFGVQDESSKLNLGKLLELDASNPGWGREVLMRLPQMTETMADHILDWIDEDDEAREFGAESEFYLEEFGVQPRNAIPPSLADLVKIPEVSNEILFGVEANQPSEEQRQSGEQIKPWSEFLTVRSAERNETYEGNSRINLNGADLFELHAAIVELVNIETANFVVLSRQYGLASASSAASVASGGQAKSPSEIQIDFTVEPQYEFESVLDIVGAFVQLGDESEDSASVTFVSSPFAANGAFDDLLEAFLDGTDVLGRESIPGRVNIMLASREVLLAVPGMEEELAEQIISNRENFKNRAKNCFWLLANRLVNIEQMKALSPHISVRGEIVSFVYAGWSHSSLAPVAFRATVDASGKSAKLLSNQKILNTETITASLRNLEENR